MKSAISALFTSPTGKSAHTFPCLVFTIHESDTCSDYNASYRVAADVTSGGTILQSAPEHTMSAPPHRPATFPNIKPSEVRQSPSTNGLLPGDTGITNVLAKTMTQESAAAEKAENHDGMLNAPNTRKRPSTTTTEDIICQAQSSKRRCPGMQLASSYPTTSKAVPQGTASQHGGGGDKPINTDPEYRTFHDD